LDFRIKLKARTLQLLALDLLVVVLAYAIAWAVRAVTARLDPRSQLTFMALAATLYLVTNLLFGLYTFMWRYASAGEVLNIVGATATATGLLTLIDLVWPTEQRLAPLSVVALTGFFTTVGFTLVRYRLRLWASITWRSRGLLGRARPDSKRVLIVGAGEAGQILCRQLRNSSEGMDYEIVGYIDDDPAKLYMQLHGFRVLGSRHNIPNVVAAHDVDMIIIAIHKVSGEEFRKIVDTCLQTPAQVKVIPDPFVLLGETEGAPPTREIEVEDLLHRPTVEIDKEACGALLHDQSVLVTGAAGSIGSELSAQVATYNPACLLLLDNNETGLHDLMLDLQMQGCEAPMVGLLSDITDSRRIEHIFGRYKPDIVFHTAAYKHVPLLESEPGEAVRVNVLGTRIVFDAAVRHASKRFVLVSTDKAVEPVSVMGASKRVCELLVLGSHQESDIERAVVRFGNVINSRGSVVPTFWRQIDRGGPVTITDPRMKRYFMAVSEAVSLILQAVALTNGSDVFMLDMGEELSILDLAHRMIRLRGLRVGEDIEIVYAGIRPGERLSEVLCSKDELESSTDHPHVFRVLDGTGRAPDLAEAVAHLEQLVCEEERPTVRKLLEQALAPDWQP
jgi:FlaA1/EpsC-like NDP-sugar epimerase